MNKKEFNNLKDIKLSSAEKAALFERIKLRAGIPNLHYRVASPFMSFSYVVTHRYAQAGVFALLFVVLSGATAFASLGTLPGDALYGVKTNVVENIPRILYRTPEQKAQHNFKNIEKRISEFEKLAEKGELSQKNTETLEKEIEKNLGDFDAQIKEIKEQKQEEKKEAIEEKKGEEATELGRYAIQEMKIAESEEKIELEEKLEETLEKHAEKIKEIREEMEEENREVLEAIVERADSSSDLDPKPATEEVKEEVPSEQAD